MNIAIMIPARAGSKRVPNKNIRLLSGKPLISYVIETSQLAGMPVYVNSDSPVILGLADEYDGVMTYRRPDHLGGDGVTNDDFMYDFMKAHPSFDYVIQVLPTSPFVLGEEIIAFRDRLVQGDLDTLVSVKEEQIACLYANEPINFRKTRKNPPSQEMTPVQVYATSLMGWKSNFFTKAYSEQGFAYHGGEGKTDYFVLKGFSSIDIDNEEDFLLAEAVARFVPFKDSYQKFYYKPGTYTDTVVPRVLKDDGIDRDFRASQNQPVINVPKLMASRPPNEAWYETLIDSDSNSCTVVNQMPGEGNREHYHAKWNEWWYIIRGQWRFDIETESYVVSEGDLVFIEKGRKHHITAIGDAMASRLAVSRYDVEHIYSQKPGAKTGET